MRLLAGASPTQPCSGGGGICPSTLVHLVTCSFILVATQALSWTLGPQTPIPLGAPERHIQEANPGLSDFQVTLSSDIIPWEAKRPEYQVAKEDRIEEGAVYGTLNLATDWALPRLLGGVTLVSPSWWQGWDSNPVVSD